MVGTRLYVGGLPHGVNERDLERFFRGYGRMREVLLKNGYGFVEFDDYRDADDAVYELNGKKILGVRVTVERARGTPRGRDYGRDGGGGSYGSSRGGGGDYHRNSDRGGDRYSSSGGGGGGGGGGAAHNDRYGPPTRTKHRLIVENLSTRVSWQDLKDYMRKAGEVTFADAHKKRRNEGIVEFMCHADLVSALDKLDKSELNGRVIRLVEDKSCRSRSYSSSSRSRSRSRRRSRSRSADAKDKDRSKSRSRSRSPTPKKAANNTNDRANDRSRSASRKKSASRSRSRSGADDRARDRERSRSRSKSRSYSKERRPADSRSKSRSVDN